MWTKMMGDSDFWMVQLDHVRIYVSKLNGPRGRGWFCRCTSVGIDYDMTLKAHRAPAAKAEALGIIRARLATMKDELDRHFGKSA